MVHFDLYPPCEHNLEFNVLTFLRFIVRSICFFNPDIREKNKTQSNRRMVLVSFRFINKNNKLQEQQKKKQERKYFTT